jgi:membrane protein CcdC involved in cytochrome C biogenesis
MVTGIIRLKELGFPSRPVKLLVEPVELSMDFLSPLMPHHVVTGINFLHMTLTCPR